MRRIFGLSYLTVDVIVSLMISDSTIFEFVCSENNLNPAKTIFIDDSPQHVEGAKAAGIRTIYLEKGMTIEEHIFLPKK